MGISGFRTAWGGSADGRAQRLNQSGPRSPGQPGPWNFRAPPATDRAVQPEDLGPVTPAEPAKEEVQEHARPLPPGQAPIQSPRGMPAHLATVRQQGRPQAGRRPLIVAHLVHDSDSRSGQDDAGAFPICGSGQSAIPYNPRLPTLPVSSWRVQRPLMGGLSAPCITNQNASPP